MNDYKGIEVTPAQRCCVCWRLLTDPDSISLGIGPVCRKRVNWHTTWDHLEDEYKADVVRTVNAIARAGKDFETISVALDHLAMHGLSELVDAIMKRFTKITITETNGGYLVKAPYLYEANNNWYNVGKWKGKEQGRFVPQAKKRDLFALLVDFYTGCVVTGPKGSFQL